MKPSHGAPALRLGLIDMKADIDVHLAYRVSEPCVVLMEIEAAATAEQQVDKFELSIHPEQEHRSVPAEEAIGHRTWMRAEETFECTYRAQVDVTRPVVELAKLNSVDLCDVPADVIKYLMSSRYCHPETVHQFVEQQFGETTGGLLIQAMRDWIFDNFDYVPGASDSNTTAFDSLEKQQGVCRDYAHVLITLARAVGIPARMVSAYAPNVRPQDFHALAEVYLDDAWHMVDATGMSTAEETIVIGVGRDAADISFLTAYGNLMLQKQSVMVSKFEESEDA